MATATTYSIVSFDTSAGLEENKIKLCVKLCCGHCVTLPKTVMKYMKNDTVCINCIGKNIGTFGTNHYTTCNKTD